jgi:hypothetical protein
MLAIVMAAAVFFAASWGYLKLLIGPPGSGGCPLAAVPSCITTPCWRGSASMLGVGLLAGLLIAVPRISPLAAGLPGLALLAWTGLYLFSVRHAVQYIPLKSRPYGIGFEALLFDGVLALVGMAMVIPLFVPSRWRGKREVSESEPYAGTTGSFPDLQATQTMNADSGLLSDWTQTRPQQQAEPGNPTPPGTFAGTLGARRVQLIPRPSGCAGVSWPWPR